MSKVLHIKSIFDKDQLNLKYGLDMYWKIIYTVHRYCVQKGCNNGRIIPIYTEKMFLHNYISGYNM